MSSLVRCIDKEGKVRMLSQTVANNAYFMRKYGFKIQDLKKEAPIAIPESQETPTEVKAEDILKEGIESGDVQEAVKSLEVKPKQRRTRKPKAQ